jgi:hypothetical protein
VNTETKKDWLDEPVTSNDSPGAPVASDDNDTWLRIESAFKMPYDSVRFQCMKGSNRVWACDGEYVAYRPVNHTSGREVNPRTAQRHQSFLDSGHYEHVGTFDEVQIFKLLPGSPFRRDNRVVTPGQNLATDMRECAIAAVRRDWVLYHDILEVVAGNIKSRYDANTAAVVYGDILAYIRNLTEMRSGPIQAEVDAGLASVRKKRGLNAGKKILVPMAQS